MNDFTQTQKIAFQNFAFKAAAAYEELAKIDYDYLRPTRVQITVDFYWNTGEVVFTLDLDYRERGRLTGRSHDARAFIYGEPGKLAESIADALRKLIH